MAQTKKKRRSKHRGTAAGTISARGRTGRPPSPDERKKAVRDKRLNRAPTWSGSFKRAALAASFMFIFLFVTNKGSNRFAASAVFALLALLLYVPAGYYMEVFLYRRRQAKKAAEK